MTWNGCTARYTRTSIAVLCLLSAVGCAASASKLQEANEGVRVTVTPDAATLLPQESISLQASVVGAINLAVQWSVVGGAANGTVTQSGEYTAPSTTGTFQVMARSLADTNASGTATLLVMLQPPGGTPMTTAHRTSGVAPLAVFFDAVDTAPSGYASPFAWTSGVSQPTDYEATQYVWDFGDPSSGSWLATGKSRNAATGYTAAHVYENPGTYVVTLNVTSTAGVVWTYTQTITVTPFTGTTYYVAANGADANDGRTTATPFRTVDKAMSLVGTNVRILFRRGDTFSTATYHHISSPGPGIIGAYGAGSRPVINCSFAGQANIFQFAVPGNDWRVMDLDLVGPGGAQGPNVGTIGPPNDQQAVNLLQLRIVGRNWSVPFGWGDWTPIFQTPHDGMFVVECEAPGSALYSAYFGGRRLAILGNIFQDPVQSHVLRVWQAHKGVISNNRLERPGGQRHAIKLHGPDRLESGRSLCPETRWVTISDNVLRASGTSQWTASIGPQNGNVDERVSHVVYERNRHYGSPTVSADYEGSSTFTLLRNNVFDGTLADYYTAVLSHRRGIEPVPTDVRIFNNTIYKGGTNRDTVGFDIGGEVANCQIRNNLLGTSAGGTVALVRGGGGAGWVSDHNLATGAPGFTNAGAGDFSLQSSPAVDAGVALPEVRADSVGVPRPLGSGYDVGAFESR